MNLIKNSGIAVSLIILFASCNAQNKPKNNTKDYHSDQEKGTNPKVDIVVNKKYDSKGNLIKSDSTYSYFYTSKGLDSLKIAFDSLLTRFKSSYNSDFENLINKNFSELFLNDTLMKYDFLNDDFFRKRYELNQGRMDKLFFEMDSLKNKLLVQPQPVKEQSNKQKMKKQ